VCHFRILFIFTFILTAFWATQVQAQGFSFLNSRKQQTLYFDLTKNLIIVPIYINQKGPFNFILDTGVSPMVILDPKLKESLRVPYPRAIKISGYGNFEEIDAFIGTTRVKIGDAEIENMPTVFLKEDVTNISGFVGKKIYGLLGYHFFNSFVVQVNYANKKLKFTSPKKKAKLKGEKINILLVGNKPYVNLVLLQDNLQANITAVIDCGAGHAISLEALNAEAFPVPSKSIEGSLGNGLASQITGKVGRVKSLSLGSFSFKDIVAKYPKYNIDTAAEIDRNANIGAEILSRFNITYDYANKHIYLKKNFKYSHAFEYDMSGIDLYTEEGPPSRSIINRIDPDSPAEIAGFEEGDEIISVNFKPIESYPLNEVDAILRSKEGNNVILEIWRNGSTFIKLLKLKQRI
jgi:hypothetical protein